MAAMLRNLRCLPRELHASGMQLGIVSGTEVRRPNQTREPGIFEASGSRTVVHERSILSQFDPQHDTIAKYI